MTPFRKFVLSQPRCICQEGGWMCERCDRIVIEHERIVAKLRDHISDLGWMSSPDRMGS